MPFATFLNHTLTVWRPSVQLGALREEKRKYTALATVPAAVRRPSARLGDTGPGLSEIGERIVYLESTVDVAERDVLQFVTGPDAPELLEIDSPPTRLTSSVTTDTHLEVTCRFFAGPIVPVTGYSLMAGAGTFAEAGTDENLVVS
jgi:hypothetical protein